MADYQRGYDDRQPPRAAARQQAASQLVDATVDEFLSGGYSGSTARAIADRARVAVGSLYRDHPSVHALIDAALVHRAQALLDDLGTALRDGDTSLAELLARRPPNDDDIVLAAAFAVGARHELAGDLLGDAVATIRDAVGRADGDTDVLVQMTIGASLLHALALATTDDTDAIAAALDRLGAD